MSQHHFISYSRNTAQQFALDLYDALRAGPPPFEVWLDQRDLHPGNWDAEIEEALRACASLLFIMTPDSVQHQSVCTAEWTRALKYKKPVIPLKLSPDVEVPFRLDTQQHIDFTGSFQVALAQLRRHLRWLETSEDIPSSPSVSHDLIEYFQANRWPLISTAAADGALRWLSEEGMHVFSNALRAAEKHGFGLTTRHLLVALLSPRDSTFEALLKAVDGDADLLKANLVEATRSFTRLEPSRVVPSNSIDRVVHRLWREHVGQRGTVVGELEILHAIFVDEDIRSVEQLLDEMNIERQTLLAALDRALRPPRIESP